MPTIVKQKPPTTNPTTTRPPASRSSNGKLPAGVLSRIEPLGNRKRGFRLSVYGRPKTGKTRLACSFPKPLLLIGTEDGTMSVVGIPGIDFVMLDKCWEFGEIIKGPVEGGKYATVVLDNGTRFRDMRISEILGLEKIPMQKGWGFAGRDQWIECANSMKEMLHPLFDVARRTTLNVVIIAQEQNFSGDDAAGRESDLITPTISSALGKSVCDWVNAECDYVAQTMIREKVVKEKGTIAGVAQEVERRTGKMEYCLRVGPHEVYYTGSRLPNGRVLKEDFIVDPTYEKVRKAIVGD